VRSLEPTSPSLEPGGPRLSPEESEALALFATGLGTEAVAMKLGLPCHDVHNLVASAVLKLGARSKLEAVIAALASGDIVPPP
jgi:LuxR family transcriptional regulator, regulator of acetate metabolism